MSGKRSDPAVLAAGTVNADLVLDLEGRLEPGASLVARRLLRTSGGRAANAAVMATRLGTPARLFGCVGSDELAEQALAGPRRAGVDLAPVRHVPGPTGLVAILVAAGGVKTMVLAPGANDAFSEDDGERLAAEVHAAPERTVLVVDSEVSPGAVERALEAAHERGRAAVLDPTRPERVTDRLLELADHVMPNADEAARMTGVAAQSPAGAEQAARRLGERGARTVHVRLPGGICLTRWQGGQALLRAPSGLSVVDTTGAGDAFAGTLATALMAGRPVLEAARLAVAAAACAVTRLGAQESYPDRPALLAMAARVRVADG